MPIGHFEISVGLHSAFVEVGIRQADIPTPVIPARGPSSAGKAFAIQDSGCVVRLSREFHVAARCVRTSKDVANIRQSKSPAILKIPVPTCEARQSGLKIQLRVQGLD